MPERVVVPLVVRLDAPAIEPVAVSVAPLATVIAVPPPDPIVPLTARVPVLMLVAPV